MKKPNSIIQETKIIARFTERAIPLARPSGAGEAQISEVNRKQIADAIAAVTTMCCAMMVETPLIWI